MIVNKTDKSFQTFDDFPAENWLVQFAEQGIDIGMTAEEAETAFYVVEDGSALAMKIVSSTPYYDFVTDEKGNLVDVTPTAKPHPEPSREEQLEAQVVDLQSQVDALLGVSE